ncbi:winged helix DNA-binding domain-containing protein [Pseudonocardia endophytica]|uniref:Winged helix DNA-binding protein n=1 Tax=Pseudonocardia endophytica TaxID=401976 RepID=A0A4R1HM79_PSEEN|nr:winged helix DNA-binding domain-containing protein [Pseudonocardia endophytica]TCK22221.1 winged helix DNA-binding protein [Pseudonocardia endophytica]
MSARIDLPELARHRLTSTGLHGPAGTAQSVVGALTAVQCQDFGPAKWSVGQRAGAGDAEVQSTFDAGGLIRTHVLRPTWHLVLPDDLRWLLELTGPRVEVKNAYYARREGIDDELRLRTLRAVSAALSDGTALTRAELAGQLAADGIELGGVAGSLLLMHAEQQALVCSGPMRGKQHTYMLVDARVPPAAPRQRDEMLAELVHRYLAGHGPATVHDVVWWSSLTVADVRRGLDALGDVVTAVDADGLLAAADAPPPRPGPRVVLVQAYDEYVVGYADPRYREHPDSPATAKHQGSRHVVLLDGRAVGRWRRTTSARSVRIEVTLDVGLHRDEVDELHSAAGDYARHLGLDADVAVAHGTS